MSEKISWGPWIHMRGLALSAFLHDLQDVEIPLRQRQQQPGGVHLPFLNEDPRENRKVVYCTGLKPMPWNRLQRHYRISAITRHLKRVEIDHIVRVDPETGTRVIHAKARFEK